MAEHLRRVSGSLYGCLFPNLVEVRWDRFWRDKVYLELLIGPQLRHVHPPRPDADPVQGCSSHWVDWLAAPPQAITKLLLPVEMYSACSSPDPVLHAIQEGLTTLLYLTKL